MFITVNKVTKSSKKDDSGKPITEPISGKTIHGPSFIVEETIRKDEIRSVRKWHKNKEEEKLIEGDMCAIYLYSNKKHDTKATEMHLAESMESFNQRIGSIKIKDGQKG